MNIPFFGKKKRQKNIPQREEDVIGLKDIISPSSIEISSNSIKLGERLAKTFFIFSYPRYLSTGWFSPIINLDIPMDISLFLHPVETNLILTQLRKKVTDVQAEIAKKEE
ncbi:MAG: conjugal transfer protein TraC, partial [Candidatus Paceibacterota bacterium]